MLGKGIPVHAFLQVPLPKSPDPPFFPLLLLPLPGPWLCCCPWSPQRRPHCCRSWGQPRPLAHCWWVEEAACNGL
jgi:hypothetical protein